MKEIIQAMEILEKEGLEITELKASKKAIKTMTKTEMQNPFEGSIYGIKIKYDGDE